MLQLKLRIALSILFSVIISLFIHIPNTYASTLFEDNFDSGTNNKWIVVGDLGWNVQNGQYGIHLDPGLSNTVPSDNNWNYSWTQITYDVDLIGNAGVDKNILVKFHDNNNFIEIHANDQGIFLDKTAPLGGGILGFTPTILQNGVIYHFRSEINNENIKVYLNNNLIFNISEGNPLITNWKIGLRAGTGSVRPTDVWFDNIQVTDLVSSTPTPSPTPSPTPISLPNLNVPDIKQYSLPWGPHTYDHANSWSSVPTITSWGCALTSADMLLQYYGYSITPDGLNNWLNQQADGYIANGLLNWLAISRYTKQNSTTQPSLEFIKKGNNAQDLVNELQNNRPAILEEPGHFVVAKSQTQTSFGINDPAYSNHPTLASYNNLYNSLETYIPSHTDLSYIMLTLTNGFDLHVFDTDNGEILESTFLNDPLTDDVNNSSKSGQALTTFLFPKPMGGNYRTEVTGNGVYELDSYLYNINGNVNLNKINGITTNNEIDKYNIIIGQTNSTSENVTIDSLITDWKDANSKGLIKTKSVYNEILLVINTINKLILNHNKLVKLALQGLNILIKYYTPKFIDLSVAQIFNQKIQILINSL
jgi:hypothetical protein